MQSGRRRSRILGTVIYAMRSPASATYCILRSFWPDKILRIFHEDAFRSMTVIEVMGPAKPVSISYH